MLIPLALADDQQVPLLLLRDGRGGQSQAQDQDQDVPRFTIP